MNAGATAVSLDRRSVTSDQHRRAVHDYVVSTTVRKMEQLGGKWARVKTERQTSDGAWRLSPPTGMDAIYNAQTKTALPLRQVTWSVLVPPTDAPAGRRALEAVADPGIKLATILRNACAFTRWEPLNGATLHCGLPSGGGLYGVDLHVVGRRGGEARHFTYVPAEDRLRQDGGDVEQLLGDAELVMVVTADVARYLQPYGEFAPVLAFLESGFLVALLQELLGAGGWRADVSTLHSHAQISRQLQLERWSRIPVAVLRIRGTGARAALMNWSDETLTTSEQTSPVDQLASYPRIQPLVDAVAVVDDVEPRPAVAHDRIDRDFDVVAAVRSRSSGMPLSSDPAHRPYAIAEFASLLDRVRQLQVAGCSDLDAVALRLVGTTVDRRGVGRAYDLDMRSGSVLEHAGTTAAAATGPLERERRCGVVVGMDGVDEMARVGPRSFLTGHLAAGVLGMRLCLAASSYDQVARPLRGYIDRTVDTLLPLEWHSVLQVAIGDERRSNPVFPLGWG